MDGPMELFKKDILPKVRETHPKTCPQLSQVHNLTL